MPKETGDLEIINSFMTNMEAFISGLPPADIRIKHVFAPGVYLRKMYAKKGSILISKVHRTEHVFIVSKGRILVYDGEHEAVILKSSYDGITMPGTRRIGVALEDTIWINVHPTKIKPIDQSDQAVEDAVKKIEKTVILPYKNLKKIKT